MGRFPITPLGKDKKAVNAIVAFSAAAAVLVTSLFSAPVDLVREDSSLSPVQIVQVVDTDNDDDGGDEGDCLNQEEKRGVRAKIRQLLLRMPLAIRACVLMPLWCFGFAIEAVASVLLKLIVMPVLSAVLKLLLFALIAFALVVLGLKLLFPGIPLRLLLTKQNLIILICACVFCGIISTVLDYAYPDKWWLPGITNLVGAGTVLSIIAVKIKLQLAPKSKA